MREFRVTMGCVVASVLMSTSVAQSLTADVKAKIEAKAKQLQVWGTDPAIVSAVRMANSGQAEEAKAMTNEKWKSLTILDPYVRSFTRNPLAVYLKGKKDDTVTECFVSGADGTKVAFFSKTTYWSHKDKDKHHVPMSGRVWTGPVEVDESSGQQQIQIGVPVLDGGKPIGSIVVGIGLAKLK